MQTQAGPLVGPDDDSRSPTIAGVLVDRRVDHLEDLHRLLREEELEVTIPGKLPAYHTVKQGLTQGEKHQLSFDRNRLINIDRSTFNRESPDYKVLQGYLARTILTSRQGVSSDRSARR